MHKRQISLLYLVHVFLSNGFLLVPKQIPKRCLSVLLSSLTNTQDTMHFVVKENVVPMPIIDGRYAVLLKTLKLQMNQIKFCTLLFIYKLIQAVVQNVSLLITYLRDTDTEYWAGVKAQHCVGIPETTKICSPLEILQWRYGVQVISLQMYFCWDLIHL